MRILPLLLAGAVALSATAANAADTTNTALALTGARALDTTRVITLLTRADEATFAGRNGEARKLYRTLINEQRDANRYAGLAMWRLAVNYHYAGEHRRAAELFEETAQEAARFGDPALEMKASFESAVLWQKVRRNDLAARHVERVRCLLQSPAIASDVKQFIENRIVDSE